MAGDHDNATASVRVRRLEPADHDAVLELARALALWFHPTDQLALAIDLKSHEGFVAERDGAILGFLTYHLVGADSAELSWLGVEPASQGQGIAGALLAALESELRARRVRDLRVSTIDDSTAEPAFENTRRFYRRHGFVPIGRDENYFARGRHRLLLHKVIEAGP